MPKDIEGISRGLLHSLAEVRIRLKKNRNPAVAQALAHDFRINAGNEKQRRRGVAQIVQANRWELGSFAQAAEYRPDGVDAERFARLRREDEVIIPPGGAVLDLRDNWVLIRDFESGEQRRTRLNAPTFQTLLSKPVSRAEAFFADCESCWAEMTVGEFQAIGHGVLAQFAAAGGEHVRMVKGDPVASLQQ